MLRKHCRRIVLRDGAVEVFAQGRHELIKACTHAPLGGLDQGSDALVMAAGDVCYGVGPLLPVATLSAALNDLCEDSRAQLA